MFANPGERGCGTRQQGGVYAELPIGENGVPLWKFLIDYPVVVPPGMEVPDRGVVAFKTPSGVVCVADHVGEAYYPNVADFVGEVCVMGLSRRIPKTFDFSLLTPDSRLLTCHSKAYIANWREWPEWECVTKQEKHAPGLATDCCGGIWERDVEGGEPQEDGTVLRRMPSFTYKAHPRPEHITTREYVEAFFAAWPIAHFVVVQAEDGSHVETVERMRRISQIPTFEVPE